jgi:hypothetical protein
MATLLPTVKATQFAFPHYRGEDMPRLGSGSLRLERARNGYVFARPSGQERWFYLVSKAWSDLAHIWGVGSQRVDELWVG